LVSVILRSIYMKHDFRVAQCATTTPSFTFLIDPNLAEHSSTTLSNKKIKFRVNTPTSCAVDSEMQKKIVWLPNKILRALAMCTLQCCYL
jgi:hypothetical protein